jgi:hypothetical protein
MLQGIFLTFGTWLCLPKWRAGEERKSWGIEVELFASDRSSYQLDSFRFIVTYSKAIFRTSF